MSGIGTDHKRLLSETVDERLAALDIGWNAGGNDKELARLGGIRIPEHRRRDVALPVARMLVGEVRRSGGTERAHGKVNCAGHQSRRKTVDAEILTPKDDVANSVVVR